jgi:uncharacterized LabA/DUF88 family protein
LKYLQTVPKFLNKDGAVSTFTVFYCVDLTDESQQRFLIALALMGYRVVTKSIKKLPDGSIKANMDMEMALEILDQAPFLDEIVIVSGDGDFVSLVNRLARMGKEDYGYRSRPILYPRVDPSVPRIY